MKKIRGLRTVPWRGWVRVRLLSIQSERVASLNWCCTDKSRLELDAGRVVRGADEVWTSLRSWRGLSATIPVTAGVVGRAEEVAAGVGCAPPAYSSPERAGPGGGSTCASRTAVRAAATSPRGFPTRARHEGTT